MNKEIILLGHGSGGTLTHKLISELFYPQFKNTYLDQRDDAAVFTINQNRLAFTTDSFVVDPVFFPGGDIGTLAVCGTVNDLAVMGATPKFISAGFILEEGFPIDELKKIIQSMKKISHEARVQIVTGDTKVVPKGAADKIFINTSGIGILNDAGIINGSNAKAGDVVLINGTIGDHGIAVMAKREGLDIKTGLHSDCAPLNNLIDDIRSVSSKIHVLRDPTRGGIATTLNEIARQSKISIEIIEQDLPVARETKSLCEILGLDPLYIANEGKVIVICAKQDADKVLKKMRAHRYGKQSCIIGKVSQDHAGKVIMSTCIGGKRIIDMLTGEQLPRIC
jgi:hydrogenase expression/formation protein HypE